MLSQESVPGVLMVTPQAIMFEPTTVPAAATSAESADAAVFDDDVENRPEPEVDDIDLTEKPDTDPLQRHRMIAPLDIVTSIMITSAMTDHQIEDNRSVCL